MTDPAQTHPQPTQSPAGDRRAFDRRHFLKLGGLGATGMALSNLCGVAGPFEASDFDKLVPRDKKLGADWLASLTRRGKPEVFRGRELDFIGMPVGGIGCGQLYLAGDGRLWLWDIFKSNYISCRYSRYNGNNDQCKSKY